MKQQEIIKASLDRSVSSIEYENLLQSYAKDGKTSGADKEDLIYYTKLNAQRSRRIHKTIAVQAELAKQVSTLAKQTWLLITETWCGDAANSVPVIAKLAEENPNVDLRIVLRDENIELMDQFLTRGGRSIPKLIALDQELKVLFDWGPRPQEAQKLYWDWRESENRSPYSEFHVVLQKWYNDDKASLIQGELLEKLLSQAES